MARGAMGRSEGVVGEMQGTRGRRSGGEARRFNREAAGLSRLGSGWRGGCGHVVRATGRAGAERRGEAAQHSAADDECGRRACLHACMRGRCAHARSAHLALRPTPLAVGRARGGAARAGPVRAALPRTRVPAARAAAAACCADQRKPRADQPTPHCARAHRCPTLTPHGLCARACAASVPTPASSLGCAAASARLPGRKEAFPPIECQARTGPQGAGRRSTGPLGSAACEAANMCSHESVRWLDGGASLAPKGNADRSEARGSQTCSSSLMAAGSRFKKDAHDMAGIILRREPDEGD